MKNTRPIHICIFGDERSIHVRRWVLSLRDAGHKVDLITMIKDVNHDIGGIGLQTGSRINYLAKISALRKLVRQLNPEIFHTHQASSYGFLASFINHPKKILSVWGDDVVVVPNKNFLYKAMIKRSLLAAHRITATSKFLKSTVLNLVKLSSEVVVIPFGIDLNIYCQTIRHPQPVVKIGIVKWLKPKYGIDILIHAFDKILKAGYKAELIIAGLGPFESKYKQLVRDLGLNDKITFLGLIEQSEVLKLLESIEIFAMPSITNGESFGVAALEASATGLPVVATRVGGVPEVVKDGITGIMVDPGNINQLAAAIIRLIENPAQRAKMGQAGRNFVEQNYRWEENLRSMEKLYYEVLR
jgi:L-malate glycosyltransferase